MLSAKERKEKSSGDSEPKKKEEKSSSFDVEAKIKKIEASKLSDAEKSAYIRKLKNDAAPESTKISFAVYCQRKKIKPHHREPMQSYPSAKGVTSASFEVWEELYKNF